MTSPRREGISSLMLMGGRWILICKKCYERNDFERIDLTEEIQSEIKRNVREFAEKIQMSHGPLDTLGDDHCCHHVAKEIDIALKEYE